MPLKQKQNNTIVDVARKHKGLSIFVDALKHAGLIDTLSSIGRYTVFCAPNAVWKKLLNNPNDITELDADMLKKILQAHIVPGKIYKASDMSAGLNLPTLLKGETLTISGFVGDDKKVVASVNDKPFTQHIDIMASNGIMHQIDGIIFPPQTMLDSTTTAPHSVPASDPIADMQHWLRTANDGKQKLEDQSFATVPLSKTQDKTARDMLWNFYQKKIKMDPKRQKEMMEDKLINYENKYFMKIWYKTHGPQFPPNGGRSLYISLHGGGGTGGRSAALGTYSTANDSQWENQKVLYDSKNLPTEGIYCAPRAPTDTPNLWHEPHIYPMLSRLIENFIVFENVNPNKIYIMGYSAGSDGVYRLAPRMADRWAGAAACAGHPGNITPESVVNSGLGACFTIQMGADDSAYNRNGLARQWKDSLAKLHSKDWVEIHPNKSHNMGGEEAAVIPWMAKRTRNLRTSSIVWTQQEENPENRFYWLAVDTPTPGTTITARRFSTNTIEIGDGGGKIPPGVLRIRLDDQMDHLNLDQKIQIKTASNVVLFGGVPTRTIGVLYRTLVEREDPTGMFSSEIEIKINN